MRCTLVVAAGLVLASPALAEPFAYTIVDAMSVPAPLGGLSGQTRRGATTFEKTCAPCHTAAALAGAEAGSVRLAIVDLSVMKPEAGDHAFYEPDEEGHTRLSARNVEDIVAYLGSRAAAAAP